jgi:hypothetical protein
VCRRVQLRGELFIKLEYPEYQVGSTETYHQYQFGRTKRHYDNTTDEKVNGEYAVKGKSSVFNKVVLDNIIILEKREKPLSRSYTVLCR